MDRKQLEVLIVEDNPGDALLISELMEETGLWIHASIAKNGQMALDFFNKGGVRSNLPTPDLVILDLNLPKVNGFEVLAYIRADPKYRSIPVMVMTGSSNRDDEEKARGMGVIDYCIKPGTADEMATTMVCLKKCLEPFSQPKKKSGEYGPSATMRIFVPSQYDGNQLVPFSRVERFINDRSGSEHWKMWE
jgi:CheY-like chemotaxis protein